jgi:putative protease
VDITGAREPIIFSKHGRLRSLDDKKADIDSAEQAPLPLLTPTLSVVVGTAEGARAAIHESCEHVILSWEANLTAESGWTLSDITDICNEAHRAKTSVLLTTPRVLDDQSAQELRQVIAANLPLDGYAISTVGALSIVGNTGKELWAEASMNVINAQAALWLQEQGVSRIMPAPEASFESIASIKQHAPDCQLDLLAHGPLTGMLVEHCLIAMNMQHASKADFCPMPCMADQFSMVDRAGNKRRIKPDRYCRNHIIMEKELATLTYLSTLLSVEPASLRINGAIYDPDQIKDVISRYRKWLSNTEQREDIEKRFTEDYPAALHTLGAYPLGICRDDEISRLNLKREENNASD